MLKERKALPICFPHVLPLFPHTLLTSLSSPPTLSSPENFEPQNFQLLGKLNFALGAASVLELSLFCNEYVRN